jgi:hypothetical protein
MSDEDEVIKKAPIGLEDELVGFGGGDEILDVFDDNLSSDEDEEDLPIGGEDDY